MANKYRELKESIDAILDGEDNIESEEEGVEETLSPHELLKDIVSGIRHCIDSVDSENFDEKFLEKLKKVRDILKQDEYTDEHQLDNEDKVVEEDTAQCNDDAYGAGGMGPSIDKDGKQNYDNPNGSSYAAKHGFVGI